MNTQVKWTVRVNGVTLAECPSRQLAEQVVQGLPLEQQRLVEISPITLDGKQVLFG